MTTALFVGRFQPFHNGHLAVIKNLLHEHSHVCIVIGSANQKRTPENPFSADEREEMIRATLEAEHLPERYSVYRAEDKHDDEKWGAQIRELCSFDIAYTNNSWTARCIERVGFEVKNHKFYHREEFIGTNIRELIRKGLPWEDRVPAVVSDYIKKWLITNKI